MNRQKELAKNTIILSVGKICTQLVSFLLLPLYTTLLIPEQFGVVDLFMTYTALLTPVCNWQIENGLFRFLIDYRNEQAKQKTLFSTVFVTNILQSGVYLFLFLIFQGYITSEYKVFLALDVIANIFLNTLLQFSRGLGKNVVYSIGSFLSAVIIVVLNILFIAVFRWGVYGMFIAALLAKIVTCVYLFCAMKTWKYFSFGAIDRIQLKNILKYSLPLVPNQLSWWVVVASDRTIVSHFISIAANGIYSVANKFSTIFVTFYNIFNMSWTESVSLHMDDDDRDEFLTDIINTMFNLFSAINFGIIACMPFVFDLMINKQYNNAYYQVPILMIAVLFQVVVGLYSVIYVALKKSVEIAKTSFFAAVINILVDLVLIKSIGLYAASASTLIAYATMALYRYFDVKKYVNVCLKRSNTMVAFFVGVVTLLAYYSKNTFFCGISLFLVIIYAIAMNRGFLWSMTNEIKGKLNNKHSVG